MLKHNWSTFGRADCRCYSALAHALAAEEKSLPTSSTLVVQFGKGQGINNNQTLHIYPCFVLYLSQQAPSKARSEIISVGKDLIDH